MPDKPRSHPRRPKDDVPVELFRQVCDELVKRIGQVNAARRMGLARETIADYRLRSKTAVSRQTYDAAVRVLEEVRENGENGWDTRQARIRSLNPILAGIASGVARRKKKAEKELFGGLEDWQYEMAMDKVYADNSWAYPDKDGKLYRFADFECKHDRLPGDKTPPCGCWPEEQV